MNWRGRARVLKRLVLLGMLVLSSAAAAQDGSLVALVGATIVGQSKLGPATVLIRDGKIEQVGSEAKVTVPDGASRMDLTGKYLTAGFVDLASECADVDCLGLCLYFGVTTLRLVGQLSTDITAGLAVSPRLIPAALLGLDTIPSARAIPIGSAEDVDAVLNDVSSRGAKWILLEPAIGPDLLPAVTSKAQAMGLKVGARLGATGLDSAVDAKINALEHATSLLSSELTWTPFAFQKDPVGLYTKYVVPQAAILPLEEKLKDGMYRGVGRSKLAVVPGLASIEYPSLRRPPHLEKLPGALQHEPERFGNTSIALRNSFEMMLRATKAASDAGATVGVGTYSPGLMNVPGYAVHREMELLVQAGWTPSAAIEAATSGGARVLGLDDIGKIQPGMAADIVILGADPSQDILATQQVEGVLVAGQAVDRGIVLEGGARGGTESVGAQWISANVIDFDEQSLNEGETVRGDVFPATGTALPKTRFIPNEEGYYVRLSGRLQGSEEAGVRLLFSADGTRQWDMASYGGPALRVRGNKQQFWLRVRTVGVKDDDYFLATFLAEEDWATVQIPWKTLRQSGKGKQLSFHGRDILGIEIYTRARGQEVFYQLDLDFITLFE